MRTTKFIFGEFDSLPAMLRIAMQAGGTRLSMFMKFFRTWWTVILLSILAVAIRLFWLGGVPFGFQHDELYAGYIGRYLFLHGGTDISGHRFPLYFDTFGDFRPIGVFLLSGISSFLFGVTEFATRFPSALLGGLTIVPLFLCIRRATGDHIAALAAAVCLAFSPWHIVLSRATSDGILGLFFLVSGLALLWIGEEKRNRSYVFGSVVLFVLSYFFYHSFRLVVPFFILPFYFFPKGIPKKYILGAVVVTFALSVSLFFTSAGSGRLSQVSFTKNEAIQTQIIKFIAGDGSNRVTEARTFHNKPATYVRVFLDQYAHYFSPSYLYARGGLPDRYIVPDVGLFPWIMAPIMLLGFVALFKKKSFFSNYVLWMLLISPVPAAITYEDIPNVHRSIVLIVPLTILAGMGVSYAFELVRSRMTQKIILVIVGMMLCIETAYFWHQYVVHQRAHKSYFRNDAFREMVQGVAKLSPGYAVVYVPQYESIPLYYLYFTQNFSISPTAFMPNGAISSQGNIEFVDQWCPSLREEILRKKENNVLFVNKGDCPADGEHTNLREIFQSDGAKAFTLYGQK